LALLAEVAPEIVTIYSSAQYSFIAIAGCYLVLGNNVAQAEPIVTSRISALPVNEFDRDRICTQNYNSQDRNLDLPQVDRIAQVNTPVTLPLPLSSLVPPNSPIAPLNSILSTPILAPNNTPAVPLINAPKPVSPQNSPYVVPPQAIAPQKVDPFSTQFILNGDKISHLTPTIAKTGLEAGNFRTSDLNFNVYRVIKADNIQSVTKDSVVRVRTQIETVGIRSTLQNRDTITTTFVPQTLLGVRQQISLDANCQDNSGRTCTYIPGITIDDSKIDPRTLQPTGVKITSQYGDVIPANSIAASRQPGFQGGADGQNFGVDLYLPAVGVVTTPRSLNAPSMGLRRDELSTAVAVNYTQMDRNFATNGVASSLGQTIRSVNYINGDRHQPLNLVVQALSRFLPEAPANIDPGKPGARIVVNPNLYRVANAIRIPDNSQTIYQAGTGFAISRGQDPQILPGATHQAIWIGLSPVVERTVLKDYSYITRSAPQIISSNGGEGGIVPVAVNLNNFGFNSGGLQNPYAQGYVTVYNRDVDRVNVEVLRQRTDYYPHLSFTGANLGENSLWRYYTGAIATIGSPSPIKAYVGTDYSIANRQGLSIGVGGIGYVNPDPEYVSQFFANVNQSVRLGTNPRNKLVVGVNANYLIGGTVTIQSTPIRATQSYINTGIAVELGDVSIGGTQFIGNLLPESTESKTILNLGWKVTDRLNLGAFYTVADRNISTNPYGLSLSLALDPSSNSSLSLGWNAAEIDFRRTLGANANTYRDNTFSVSLRLGL
jgi:hypothetical protein